MTDTLQGKPFKLSDLYWNEVESVQMTLEAADSSKATITKWRRVVETTVVSVDIMERTVEYCENTPIYTDDLNPTGDLNALDTLIENMMREQIRQQLAKIFEQIAYATGQPSA